MQKEGKLYTVEGTIQAMRVVPGVLNLVEDIQKGALFTGVAAGLAEQAGMLANATNLALYEGEDAEHIALLINGQLAVGTFEWLQDLKVDDEVKLVVSDIKEGPLFIHAILRKSDQLLWMPYSVAHTRFGWIMHAMKLCLTGLVFIFAFALFCNFLRPVFSLNELLLWVGLGGGAMMAFVGFMSTSGVMNLGEQAEDIFKALDIKKSNRFKIKPYSIMNLHFLEDSDSLKKKYVFKFADALSAHKKKFNFP